MGDAIRNHEPNILLESHPPGRNTPLSQSLRQNGVWALIFLPSAHINTGCGARDLHLFACACFLKCGTDVKGLAFGGQYHGEQPL